MNADAGFVNELGVRSPLLTEAAAGTLRYCREKLGLAPTDAGFG